MRLTDRVQFPRTSCGNKGALRGMRRLVLIIHLIVLLLLNGLETIVQRIQLIINLNSLISLLIRWHSKIEGRLLAVRRILIAADLPRYFAVSFKSLWAVLISPLIWAKKEMTVLFF